MSGDVQLIGLDWGTSNLRAYLYDTQGVVVDVREQGWGIRHLPDGGFPAAMRAITTGWPPCVTLASGMVGSRQGWLEVPYIQTPTDARSIAKGIRRVDAYSRQPLWIVPGLCQESPANVMRGEETQIIGAMNVHACNDERVQYVLPGTHSKWVLADGARIAGFQTFMTGEMYALMMKHSILGAGVPEQRNAVFPNHAFVRGVHAAKDSAQDGAWSRLFSTRALMLSGSLSGEDVPEFLSGLLIGEEFRVTRRQDLATQTPLCLIGDASLCARYACAAEHFDYPAPSIVSDAASHGLWELARQSGLLAQATTFAFSGAHA